MSNSTIDKLLIQLLEAENKYIEHLTLIDKNHESYKESIYNNWLSTINTLLDIHTNFYKKIDNINQDSLIKALIDWGNVIESPYQNYIKNYNLLYQQHHIDLHASIKKILSSSSSSITSDGLLAAPFEQLKLYKSIYKTLLNNIDTKQQQHFNRYINNINYLLKQSDMAALETSSNITDLMSFQQLVDCTEVIDLFTGTSMDYELRPRPGKIILQDKFVLLTDNNNNNGQPLRVYMILTSDMLMICHQKNESTGRYQLLYPPLAVNDIYIQPIMLDRELIGEYTLEITILNKKLTVRAESKEVRNIWSGMPSTTTAKNAIKVSIPLIHVVNPSLKSTNNNKNNNNSAPSPVVVKSDLPPSSFYQNNNNNDMSPVDSDEDDDDDEDSDATYPSSNNLNISSTATAPQPPKKDNTMKSLPMPVINISLHDDEKIIQGDQKQNQPLKPRVSSIRAPLPNPDLKSSKVSPSSANSNSNQQIESKPLPRTSSIRQNNKNSSQQSSTSPMMQRQPSNPNQPPSSHHQHRPLPSPGGNNNNNNHRVSSVPRPPMQYPQQQQHSNNNASNQHYHQRPPINQYPQPRPPQHYQQRPPMHYPQQQQQQQQQQRPLSNNSSLQQRSSMHHPQQQQRPPAHHSQQQRPHSNQPRPPMHYSQQQPRPPLQHSNQSQPRPPTHYLQQQQQPRPHPSQQQRHHSQTAGLLTNANVSKPLPNTTTQPRPQPSKSQDLNNNATTSSSHRPMPPTPPPQQNQFNAKQSSSSSQSSTNDSSSTIGEMDMQQSPLPPTPNSSDSSSGSSLLRLSPEDLASPPRSPNPYNNNQINGIRQVLFRNDQCQVFRWKDETWYAVDGQCLLEVRQTFSNRSCIAIRVQKSGELYLNAWILPQTQIRMASATDISLGVVMGPRHETYLIHFEKTTEATEFNQILQQMHHTAILQAQQQSSSNGTLRHSPPTELRDNYDDEDENDDDNIIAGMNGMTFNNNNNGNGSSTVRRTLVRSTSLMQSGQEPTPIPQTLEKVMQCKCKLFSQNEHSNWSSFGSVQLIVSLQIPSQRMHIQILHDKKRGFSKIIPSGTNITSSSAPSSPSLSTTNPNQIGTNSSSSLSSSSASLAAPSSSPTETTLVSATVYSNNVERLNAKRITFLLVNERERTESMVYMVQVREEDAGNALYDYLKIKNAQNGW